jgi:hypothetical protein
MTPSARAAMLANGRKVQDLYLFEVKKPSESKKPWDYYKQLAVRTQELFDGSRLCASLGRDDAEVRDTETPDDLSP